MTSSSPKRIIAPNERHAIFKALLLMKGAGSSVSRIAVEAKVSRQTADNYRRLLILNGYSIETPRTPEEADIIATEMVSLSGAPKAPEIGVRKMEQAIEKKLRAKANRKGPLKAEDRLNLLSDIAETEGISPQARVTAVTKLDDIEFRSRSPESFGPPAPLSREDRIIRGMRVMECLGRDLSLEAFNRMEACKWKPPFPSLGKPDGKDQTQTDQNRTKKDSSSSVPTRPEGGAVDQGDQSNLPGNDLPQSGPVRGSSESREGGDHLQEKAPVSRSPLETNRPRGEADVQKENEIGSNKTVSSQEEAEAGEDD